MAEYKQTLRDRMHESAGMKARLKDNQHASPVKKINCDAEKYDLNKIREYQCGTKGYPSEALKDWI